MTLNIYTSTGFKLIHHPDTVKRIKKYKKGTPLSLQVAPTSRCNLNCSFCSNSKRKKHEDLNIEQLEIVLEELLFEGLKTVEWTGGGDPTMYKFINEAMEFAHRLGLQQGMISNGVSLREEIWEENLENLVWLRISMNCLDYISNIDIPKIKGTLGFSYVMNDKTDSEVLARIGYYVREYNPKYVRIVTNCLASDEEQDRNNRIYSSLVKNWGKPYFYQAKHFNRSDKCYWCYFKPFLLHDGYVYPCSSVVLNSGAEGKFHEKFRWVKMEDLPAVYSKVMQPFDSKNCNHCVFKGQNDLVCSVLNPEMENFV